MRIGRLNVVECSDVVTKTCVVQESSRPQKLYVEKWALEQMRGQGMMVPRVLDYGRNDQGKEVLVMERIYGETLPFRITDHASKAFRDVGRQLRARTNIYDGYGWIDPSSLCGTYATWNGFLFDFANRYGQQILGRGIIDRSSLNRLLDCLQSASELDIGKSAIIHRDIKPGNIIWDGNNAYLIDWENVILGDPLFDLAQYVVRFGADSRWAGLVDKSVDLNSRSMILYRVIALIGIVDFCFTYGFGVRQKVQRLSTLLRKL